MKDDPDDEMTWEDEPISKIKRSEFEKHQSQYEFPKKWAENFKVSKQVMDKLMEEDGKHYELDHRIKNPCCEVPIDGEPFETHNDLLDDGVQLPSLDDLDGPDRHVRFLDNPMEIL